MASGPAMHGGMVLMSQRTSMPATKPREGANAFDEAAMPEPTDASTAARHAMQALSVGEVARRSGVAVSTLHFYESRGLIASARTAGNQRRYPRAVLRRVAVIKVAQRMGVPLAEIVQALSALPAGDQPSQADWAALSARWRQQLDQRIQGLTQLRDQLDGCIGCGCLSLKACPLRNDEDCLAQSGPGPHFR